jgi:murein DD-endopeptidase MepM/ murein hydrolase activator NlpD/N-acetylneuraminic acid mutarotase
VKFLHKALFLLILLKIFTLFIGESVGIAHATQAENWQKTKNNMLINHQFPAVASLSDGKALVVGAGSSSANSAEIYDPSNDNWELTNSLARSMFANTATTLNDGKVLVAGFGFSTSGSNPVSSQIYNPANNTWSLAGNMQKVRYFHQASLLNDGRILATGGINNNTGTASAEAYNPSTNQWTTAPSMNAARYGHRSNTLNDGRVLITGGGTSTSYLKSVDIYNPTVNTWTQAKPMSTQRFGHTATLLPNGKVLVTGGIGSGDPLASTEIFDPTNNTWTPANSMNASRLLHAATLRNDGKVLVTGGISRQAEGYTITNTTEIYDPATNTWIQGPYMISPRSYHATTELTNGHVLAVGGVSDINKINEWNNSAELLLPGGAPVPFLDLPWDYENDGLSFNEAALRINSYFDHQLPLLSSGLSEGNFFANTIMFSNQNTEIGYSSHDGYDYGTPAKVDFEDNVKAAAGGMATYVNNCGACGNAIHIDHGNGYQTRYYHLDHAGLITNTPNSPTRVEAEQIIGRVGFTGRVIPRGEEGAHIHFMVIEDKNKDGNFDDNVPDGVTDPFGWQSTEPDPWESYSFFYKGLQRTGNKSYYLWKHKLDSLRKELSANGGIFTIGRTKLTFSNDINLQGVLLEAQASPSVKASDSLVSLGSTIDVILKDPLGTLITVLTKPMIITINFSQADLSKFKPGTISIYSSTDRKVWKKEESFVDFLNKQATAEVDHLTYFALMGERIDTVAPTTTATLSGTQGEERWYRSDVGINISAQDNEGGLGVKYTAYKLNNDDWKKYSIPLDFTKKGAYKIEYYSEDNDGNVEEVKTIEFEIDKTPPQVSINASPNILWPPNGKIMDVVINGYITDDNIASTAFSVIDEYNLLKPKITDFEQTIRLQAERSGNDRDGRIYTIKATGKDKAGNVSESETTVIVPHDQKR